MTRLVTSTSPSIPHHTPVFVAARATPLDDPSYAANVQRVSELGQQYLPKVWLYSSNRILARARSVRNLEGYVVAQRFEKVEVAT